MRTVVLLLTLVAGLAAQARVTGVVKDAGGRPIAGARVYLDRWERDTKDDGRFAFDAVKSGSYTLVVEAPFFNQLKRAIPVESDVELSDLTLEFEPMDEGVDVPLASARDCWADAGNPPIVRTHLAAAAMERPMPAVQSTEGVVRLKVLVVPAGAVVCTAAVGGDARLAREALLAVRQWRFRPGQALAGYLDFRFSKRGNSVK